MKTITLCLSLLLIASLSLHAGEGGDREGGRGGGRDGGRGGRGGMDFGRMMRGMTRQLLPGVAANGDFDQLASSDKTEDQEMAALNAMEERLVLKLQAARLRAQDKTEVTAARKVLEKSIGDYFGALDKIEGLAEVDARIEAARQAERTWDRDARSEAREARDSAAAERETLLADHKEALDALFAKITPAQLAYTQALKAALDADAEYVALKQEKALLDRLAAMRAQAAEETARDAMRERIEQWRQQRGDRGDRREGVNQPAEKPKPEGAKEF